MVNRTFCFYCHRVSVISMLALESPGPGFITLLNNALDTVLMVDPNLIADMSYSPSWNQC